MFLRRLLSNNSLKTVGAHCSYSSASSESKSVVVVDKVKGITTIGINRPEKRNCINFEVADRLDEAITNFENDSDSAVAVLYGCGGTFCAGWDLSQVSTATDSSKFNPENLKPGNGFLGPTRRIFKKPIIAAVNGYAVAGGLELALMCDMRVVEEDAVLGVYCRRFGVPLIDGGTVRLPHVIGLGRAMDMIVTGRGVKGKEALDMGLANRLVAIGTSLGQAVNLALAIQKFPQQCLNIDRMSANYAMYSAKSFEDAVNNEMKLGSEILATESATGATAFVNGLGRHGSFSLNFDKHSVDVDSSNIDVGVPEKSKL